MMDNLFREALGLKDPWYVKDITFDKERKRIDIGIDFRKGSRFSRPEESGEDVELHKVHDTVQKTWRHLNFFEHEYYLHCRVPRIKTEEGKTIRIKPPWAGENSGFTLLFEALILQLCKNMPVKVVSEIIKENDDKL